MAVEKEVRKIPSMQDSMHHCWPEEGRGRLIKNTGEAADWRPTRKQELQYRNDKELDSTRNSNESESGLFARPSL